MKIDARVRYTRMVIKDTFLKLLAEKPLKKVTVKEICQAAQINRATFYLHYRDPYELLEKIENELFEDISSIVASKQDDPTDLMKEIFKIIEKNIELCQILFSENGDKMFLRRIMDISREEQIQNLQVRYPRACRAQLDYLYEFLTSGTVAVVGQWVKSGMQETPLEVGRVLQMVNKTWLEGEA